MSEKGGKSTTRKPYEKPRILHEKDLDLMAGTCSSGKEAFASCRTPGGCTPPGVQD